MLLLNLLCTLLKCFTRFTQLLRFILQLLLFFFELFNFHLQQCNGVDCSLNFRFQFF
ncbi:Uncharacterised protein [Vibrio cholerae]|nr:Uncharacterised protein [Vibrio cholerae]